MFNPESDPLGAGLQQIQGKISIGSGEWFGRGLFTAPRVQRSVVPVQESDFIFSVASEQLGFLGAMAILILIVFIAASHHECSQKNPAMIWALICVLDFLL